MEIFPADGQSGEGSSPLVGSGSISIYSEIRLRNVSLLAHQPVSILDLLKSIHVQFQCGISPDP